MTSAQKLDSLIRKFCTTEEYKEFMQFPFLLEDADKKFAVATDGYTAIFVDCTDNVLPYGLVNGVNYDNIKNVLRNYKNAEQNDALEIDCTMLEQYCKMHKKLGNPVQLHGVTYNAEYLAKLCEITKYFKITRAYRIVKGTETINEKEKFTASIFALNLGESLAYMLLMPMRSENGACANNIDNCAKQVEVETA